MAKSRTNRQPRHDQEPASGRDRVLAEAIRLFSAQGADGTSIQQVAEAAGMRKASLLYHFPSKDQLREAALESVLVHWKDELPRLLTAQVSGKGRFHAGMGAVVAYFHERPQAARLLVREALDRPHTLGERLSVHLQPFMGVIVAFIELGKREGRLHGDVDAHAWITELLVLVTGHFALSHLGMAVAPIDDEVMWEQRRTFELNRMARASLFRSRTHEEDHHE